MKAWRLAGLGGALTLQEVPKPQVRAGSVLVRIEAAPLLSYFRRYVEGKLPYSAPRGRVHAGHQRRRRDRDPRAIRPRQFPLAALAEAMEAAARAGSLECVVVRP